jgi:16S rRNA C967 or C1407 C5-methylase (RsmB/RsmF family)
MKRKKNPLSSARGKQQRPENVWFRRSGAGFRLFVEYYDAQPGGTVASDLPMTESKNADAEVRQGKGLSRASKRRKKKKNNQPLVVERDSSLSPEPQQAEQIVNSVLLSAAQPSTHLRPFLETMSKPLPLTFRIRLSASNADTFRQSLKEYQHILSPLSFGNDSIYQASISKSSLASEIPSLKTLLFDRSQDGTLARQELGSMLPVLALKHAGYLQRSSRVLDVCASPGSKTLQALEIIGESGRIVANDVLESRLEALQQAVERSGMSKKLISRITYNCQDATQLSIPTKLWADVVICDVPCSGDGTCRKDKHILPMWKPNHGNQLHATQVDILVRAIQLLKVGGCVCYSTCSLNPIEDEAVVAEALRRTRTDEADVELAEFPDIPGLIRRKGIREWRVADYTGEDTSADDEEVRLRWHATWQKAVDSNMDKPRKSMWPHNDADELHLERCTRLWPHDQNSGGFFLALIRKKER